MLNKTAYWLFILLLWCWLVQPASAGKLYVLLVMDTTDPVIGESVQIDQKHLKDVLQGFILPRELVFYGSSNWNGPSLNFERRNIRNNILNAIRSCPAGPEDSLVCFWSGHGAYDKEQHYFNLPFHNYLFRREVLDLMKTRKTHFTALISDTCNVPLKLPPAAEAPAYPPITETNPVFRRLFFDVQGVLDVNSASPGEEAVGDNIQGGYFTASLYETLRGLASSATEEFQDSRQNVQWKNLLSDVNDRLLNLTDKQTICVYSLPKGEEVFEPIEGEMVNKDKKVEWSEPVYSPKPGDRLLNVNNLPVDNTNDFLDFVRNSPNILYYDIIDGETHELIHLRTQLLPASSQFRLGITAIQDEQIGLSIVKCRPNSPASHSQRAITDNTIQTYISNDPENTSSPENLTENSEEPSAIPNDTEAKFYYLIQGDVITNINGHQIHNETEFRQAVRYSPEIMHFNVIDVKTGKEMYMSTRLNPGEIARFGAYVETVRNGVRVTHTQPDSPSTHCWIRREVPGYK